MTLSERFDSIFSNGRTFAPLSNASPKFQFAIDRACFEKSAVERGKVLTEKKNLPKTRGYKFVIFFKGQF